MATHFTRPNEDTHALHSIGTGWEIWKMRPEAVVSNRLSSTMSRWLLFNTATERKHSFDAKKEITIWFGQVAEAMHEPNAEPTWTTIKKINKEAQNNS